MQHDGGPGKPGLFGNCVLHNEIVRTARQRGNRGGFLSLIWQVPAIAAVAAGVLIFQNLQKFGPAITIQFENPNGLDANQTVIRSLGPIPTLASKLLQISHLRTTCATIPVRFFKVGAGWEPTLAYSVTVEDPVAASKTI